MRLSALFILTAILPAAAAHARDLTCTPADNTLHTSADTCLAAHVYDVVTVTGGTRFLDLCSPDIPDESCHLSIVSYKKDSRQVGDLTAFRGKDISIRGAVQKFDGRYVIVLNDQRQFHGQPARFIPDPRLLRNSPGEEDQDPNAQELRVNFHHHGRKLENQ
jgi:hypothetical protein